MTVLYTANFDAETKGAQPALWGGGMVWDSHPVSGTKHFSSVGSGDGSGFLLTGKPTYADLDFTYYQKVAVSNGHIALMSPLRNNGGGAIYRCTFTAATTSGFTFTLLGYNSAYYDLIPPTAFAWSVADGDNVGVRFRVNGKVVSVWIWNATTGSQPTSPSFTYTNATVLAAGYIGLEVQLNGSSIPGNADDMLLQDLAGLTGATDIIVTGPPGGSVGAASGAFSVSANGELAGSVVVTPSAGGGGGTFTPTTVTISTGVPTATFTYTPASAGVKSITVTNNGGLANPAALSYSAVVEQIWDVDTAGIVWSPFNWDSIAAGTMGSSLKARQTGCCGAYIKFSLTGTDYLKLNLDPGPYSAYAAGDAPIIMYSINHATPVIAQVTTSGTLITLATGLGVNSVYAIEIWLLGLKNSGDRWGSAGVSPANILRVTGFTTQSSAVISAPAGNRLKKAIVWGDSITEGHRSRRNGQLAPGGTGKSLAWTLGDVMQAEYAVVGYSGQDWTSAGGDNVPQFTAAWNLHSAGRNRSFTGLDYAFVVLGSNPGSPSAATVTSWITSARTAFGAGTWIFVCVPTSGLDATPIAQGVADYNTANATDHRVKLIDVRAMLPTDGMTTFTGVANQYAEDGLHLDEKAQALWGALAGGQAQAFANAPFGTPVYPAVTDVRTGTAYGPNGNDSTGTMLQTKVTIGVGVDGVVITGSGFVVVPG